MNILKKTFIGIALSLSLIGTAFAIGEVIDKVSSVDPELISKIDGKGLYEVESFNGFTFDVNTYSIDLESSSTQFLSIADASQTGLDITGDMTLEAWINPESFAENVVFSKYATSGEKSFQAYLSSGRIYFNTSADGSATTLKQIAYMPTVATYVHIAWLYDASAGTCEIVVNGSSIGTMTALNTSLFNSNAAFAIGSRAEGAMYLDGLVDEARVWNVLKTPAQINASKNIQLEGNEAGLVGYWRLNESLLDLTANNNDLTNNGSATYSIIVPF